MEPNTTNEMQNVPNNVQSDTTNEVQETGTQTVEARPVFETNEKKKSNRWMLPVMIICILLAIGGVGFGVWAMMNSNTQLSNLNAEIESLRNQNDDLTNQIENSTKTEKIPEGKEWSSTEAKNGVFYVLGADGKVIMQSDANGPTVNEVVNCESSADRTVLTCSVNTSEGEGWFLYDVYSDSLASSFEEQQ